jgi:hypothetical protein
VIQDKSIAIRNGWMHDIRRHLGADALRRAANTDDNVKEVVENTKELASAFGDRGVTPEEPFAGKYIAGWPNMTVVGPSLASYKGTLEKFTDVEPLGLVELARIWSELAPAYGGYIPPPPVGHTRVGPVPPPSLYNALAALPAPPSPLGLSYNSFSRPIPSAPFPTAPAIPLSPLTGALSESSVKTKPTTQPFNNTSTILGITLGANKILLTGDAGSEVLGEVPPEWNRLTCLVVPHHGSDGNLSQKDIERFCPQFAFISARGNSIHPSRAIVSGLVKVGAKVASTHKSGNLWFWAGTVPYRADYGPLELLRGTGEPEPVIDWTKILSGIS